MRLLAGAIWSGVAVLVGFALGARFSGTHVTPELIPNVAAAEPSARGQLEQLLKARYATGQALLALEEKRLQEGVTTLGHVCDAARWVRDSALELPVDAQERITALTNYLTLTRRLEASVDNAAANGAAPPSDREA